MTPFTDIISYSKLGAELRNSVVILEKSGVQH